MKYLNGIFKSNEISGETVLCISISEHNGQTLEPVIPEILKSYSRYVSVIQFEGDIKNQSDLVPICKEMHTAKIKTSLKIFASDVSAVNKRLFDELDYVILENGNKIMKKEYCPFADMYDWIDITYMFWPRDELI